MNDGVSWAPYRGRKSSKDVQAFDGGMVMRWRYGDADGEPVEAGAAAVGPKCVQAMADAGVIANGSRIYGFKLTTELFTKVCARARETGVKPHDIVSAAIDAYLS